jgi:hypothetical protein
MEKFCCLKALQDSSEVVVVRKALPAHGSVRPLAHRLMLAARLPTGNIKFNLVDAAPLPNPSTSLILASNHRPQLFPINTTTVSHQTPTKW